jgi:TerC family integral membrane protein
MLCLAVKLQGFVHVANRIPCPKRHPRAENWKAAFCCRAQPQSRRSCKAVRSLWSVRQRDSPLRETREHQACNGSAQTQNHFHLSGKQETKAAGNNEAPRVSNWDRQRTALSVAAGIFVGLIFFGTKGTDRGMEYLAAYFVEQSLSVDNLFVFILLFRFFQVPKHLQEKVLSYGILGAAVFRGLFVFAGVTLMEQFRAISLLFSAILLTSSGRMLWSSLREAGTDDEDTDEDMSKNVVVRTVTAALPVANDYDGNRFFTSAGDGGKLVATPLLLVLICVELTDVIFALDSVPACLGISRDPLVVYASNMMAIVGLRSWFFVVQEAIRSFRYIEQTLAVVLGLIGSKLALGFFGYEADATLSLSVILGTLAVGYSAGLIFPRSSEKS